MRSFYCYLQFALLLLSAHNSNGQEISPGRLDEPLSEPEIQHEEILKELADRMKPRNFFADADANFDDISDPNADRIKILPKQFFHLHHMKSGGSSLNRFLDCGLSRAKSYYGTHTQQLELSRGRLSECSSSRFKSCISESDSDQPCHKSIESSAYMEYCAPLSATVKFGWDEADAVTMLRHPVDRVWSMFRFQTKRCFKCQNLTDVYKIMDEEGTKAEGSTFGSGICLGQLTNHITRNLQSRINDDDWNSHDEDDARLEDALENLQNRFVVVGLLERLDETIGLLSHSFPWLEPVLEGSTDERKCQFPKVNSSPHNNGCGENHRHWDLPDHPDEETRKAIEDHNQLDMELYAVALEHFELQLEAAELQSTET